MKNTPAKTKTSKMEAALAEQGYEKFTFPGGETWSHLRNGASAVIRNGSWQLTDGNDKTWTGTEVDVLEDKLVKVRIDYAYRKF